MPSQNLERQLEELEAVGTKVGALLVITSVNALLVRPLGRQYMIR